MAASLFGLETEYAIGGAQGRRTLPPRKLVDELMSTAKRSLAHLPDAGGGVFLANGARLYGDCGAHPEFCTPECLDPWDAVSYVRAGERIVLSLLDQLAMAGSNDVDLWLLRCNVDYKAVPATWGCHESYLCRRLPPDLARQAIPHLVSRLVFTGAGGFNPRSPGLEFTVSPRAGYFESAVSMESTGDRGIFHTRNERLAAAYHRVHIICGDSLCSDIATWLKVGTTALVIAMIDAGVHPGTGIELAHPVHALHAIAGDPAGRVRVELASGGTLSAVALQRHYLRCAAKHVNGSFMPAWAGDVIREWGHMLDRLERRDRSLDTMLDWAIKRRLYARFVERRGIRWDSIADWTSSLARLEDSLETPEVARLSVAARLKLDRQHPQRAAAHDAIELARQKGLDPSRLDEVQILRHQLFELDTKFGRLGAKGIFSALDAQPGVLAHRVGLRRPVEEAINSPPTAGRARLRGEAVRKLAGTPGCVATWHAVFDDVERSLDLSNPFVETAQWGYRTTTLVDRDPPLVV
ncbi:MAG: proteasome accessory factor PafA2 family protein [Acidobacteriota bacterium]